MPRVVLRIIRRKASWEEPADQFAKIEFSHREGGLDLRPSVYVLDAVDADMTARIVQAHTEHAASFTEGPRSAIDVDLDGVLRGELESHPGKTCFVFANSVHQEVVLRDEDDLLAMVGGIIGNATARVEVTKDQQVDYARVHFDGGDAEWIAACGAGTKGEKWKSVLEKRRRAVDGG